MTAVSQRAFALLLAGAALAEGETLKIDAADLAARMEPGQKVTVVLRSGERGKGVVESLAEGNIRIRLSEADPPGSLTIGSALFEPSRFAGVTACSTRGNKRKKLPIILVSTIGTLAFIAAGATEEKKSTYLPAAAAFSVSVGVGSYFMGKRLDEECNTFVVK